MTGAGLLRFAPPPVQLAAEMGQGRGLVLGKFLPPHAGHLHLLRFARAWTSELVVVVGSLAAEPIPGAVRVAWMRELCPDATVLHLDRELPQDPNDHPQFWELWRTALQTLVPGPLAFVFASEPYGERLAAELGARFIPVDLARAAVPIRASELRAKPFLHWQHLPPCVRPWFVRSVCVFGPESTGKTTLTRALAAHFATAWVPEYARTWLEQRGGELQPQDLHAIAQGQLAAEASLAQTAHKLLFCDTDVLATVVWAETLYGACPPWIRAEADARGHDLYLLCDVDVPWVADPVRYLPQARHAFFASCEAALQARGRRYVVLRGTWQDRWQAALAAIGEVWPDAG